MKNPKSLLGFICIASIIAGPGSATNLTTAVLGYVNLEATAATSATEPSFNFVQHALAQTRKSEGLISAGGTDTLTSATSSWSTDEFAGTNGPHFVLITSGSQEGDILEIVSNTADTITLEPGSGDLSGLVGESFRVYQHNTLASVFGSDPVADGFVGGDNPSDSGQVLIYDVNANNFIPYYLNTIGGGLFNPNEHLGWVGPAGDNVSADDTVISPNTGFVIVHRGTSAYSRPVFGEVLDTVINVPIVSDSSNLVTVPYPIDTGLTLGTSGLYPQNPNDFDPAIHLLAGGNINEAETVLLWDGTQYIPYFYNDDDGGIFANNHVGWVSSFDTSTDASNTPISGGSFFVVRSDTSPSFRWTFPSIAP